MKILWIDICAIQINKIIIIIIIIITPSTIELNLIGFNQSSNTIVRLSKIK